MSNITETAPTFNGAPSDCVMMCPSNLILPFHSTFTSTSGTGSNPKGTRAMLKPMYTSVAAFLFKTTISPITNHGMLIRAPTCPHFMSHSVPEETMTGREADAPPTPSDAISVAGVVRWSLRGVNVKCQLLNMM